MIPSPAEKIVTIKLHVRANAVANAEELARAATRGLGNHHHVRDVTVAKLKERSQ